jgi:hypothetical protein
MLFAAKQRDKHFRLIPQPVFFYPHRLTNLLRPLFRRKCCRVSSEVRPD